MKVIFAKDNIVVGWGSAYVEGASVSCTIEGSTSYEVDDSVVVDVGWSVTVAEDGTPTFTAPPPRYPILQPMTFYKAFKSIERSKMKALANPNGVPANSTLFKNATAIPQDWLIADFWEFINFSISSNTSIDPNTEDVQASLTYLAHPDTPTPLVLASDARVEDVSNGVQQ